MVVSFCRRFRTLATVQKFFFLLFLGTIGFGLWIQLFHFRQFF